MTTAKYRHARQAGQTAVKAVNSARKIENPMLKLVVYGLLWPLGIVLRRNIRPYAAYMATLLAIDVVGPVDVKIPGVGMVAGTLAFIAVQYFEVWPFMIAANTENRQRSLRSIIAVIAYVIDTTACYVFWPPIKEGAPDGLMIMQFIDWGNVFTTVLTIFGLAGWFLLRKYVRRAA